MLLGDAEGVLDGDAEGLVDGEDDAEALGLALTLLLGEEETDALGEDDGDELGELDGLALGELLGDDDGLDPPAKSATTNESSAVVSVARLAPTPPRVPVVIDVSVTGPSAVEFQYPVIELPLH